MATADLTAWFLVFVRAGAVLLMFPAFAGRNVPVQVRVALAALLAFLITPVLPPAAAHYPTLTSLILALLKEAGAGLLLGFVCRLIFFVFEFAGAVITQEMGLNMAGTLNPLSEARADAPGLLLYYLAVLLFFATDLHHWMLAGFQTSYQWLPLGGAHLSETLQRHVLAVSSRMFVAGLQMAAPMMAVGFLVTLIFAVLGRAVPQMNVFAESFSVRTLAGLAAFGLSLNLLAQHVLNCLRRLPEDMMTLARILGG